MGYTASLGQIVARVGAGSEIAKGGEVLGNHEMSEWGNRAQHAGVVRARLGSQEEKLGEWQSKVKHTKTQVDLVRPKKNMNTPAYPNPV